MTGLCMSNTNFNIGDVFDEWIIVAIDTIKSEDGVSQYYCKNRRGTIKLWRADKLLQQRLKLNNPKYADIQAETLYLNWRIVVRAANASNNCARFVCKCSECAHTKLQMAFHLRNVEKYAYDLRCPNCERIARVGKHVAKVNPVIKIGTKSFKWSLKIIDEFKLPHSGHVRYYWCECECGNLGFVNKQRFRQQLAVQCDECNKESARKRALKQHNSEDGDGS